MSGVRAGLVVVLVAVGLALPAAAQARPEVLGGPRIDVTATPYVAALSLDDAGGTPTLSCSGAIVGPRTVLTSAHCFDTPGELTTGGRVRVGSDVAAPGPIDPGGQEIAIASFRTHPRHAPGTIVTPDDIAVVTLASDIAFGPRAQPIALVGANAYPAAGMGLVQAGYGKQAPGAEPDGFLHGRFASVVAPESCSVSNAVELCYAQPASAGCPGDSGGPIVSGTALVGINSSGECAAGATGVAASLAAGEIRAFLVGSDTPPVAPVETGLPSIRAISQAGSTATCAPGGWTGAPTYQYVFEDARDGARLQAGPSPTRVLAASDVGRPIRCRVLAVTAGGIGQDISGTLPAIRPAPVVAPVTTATVPTTSVPVAPVVRTPTVARPALTLTAHAEIRRRTRSVVRLAVRTGPTSIGPSVVCLSVSARARVVASRGALRARPESCRTLSGQAARTTRRLTFRVRPTRRGAVRIFAKLDYPGSLTPVRIGRTVRAR